METSAALLALVTSIPRLASRSTVSCSSPGLFPSAPVGMAISCVVSSSSTAGDPLIRRLYCLSSRRLREHCKRSQRRHVCRRTALWCVWRRVHTLRPTRDVQRLPAVADLARILGAVPMSRAAWCWVAWCSDRHSRTPASGAPFGQAMRVEVGFFRTSSSNVLLTRVAWELLIGFAISHGTSLRLLSSPCRSVCSTPLQLSPQRKIRRPTTIVK